MTRQQNFRHVVVVDFEYEVSDGDLPVVLCMVAHVLDQNLGHVRTIRTWRGDFSMTPPFNIGPDTLVVGYSLWAEMTCFLTLGWQFPVHLFDLHTAYLAVSNILLTYNPEEVRKKPRKRLSDACRAYGVEGWEQIDKGTIARDIGEGRWWLHGREACLQYCEEDVRMSTLLLYRQLSGWCRFDPVDAERILHWSTYSAKAIARIQARGMPIDVALWNLVQQNKAAVVRGLLRKFDPSHGDEESIYDDDGHWSDSRFEQWLVRAGIVAWPRLESGKVEVSGDAFALMYPAHPALEGLHALRDSLGVITRARIPIGRDGRNRPSLFPFGTATGRNAQAKSLFNAHAGMRSFMVFPQETIAIYLDWRTQEVGIAAAFSGDKHLAQDYAAGDIYHSLALMCGLTDDADVKHWKSENTGQRQLMKSLQLGVSYGMGVRSLAKGLNRHPLIASEVIIRHQQKYPRFWEWRAEMVERAMLERQMYAEFDGWPLHLSTSPNKRTLCNFPMQSGGASMLRLAACRLCDAGLIPSMLVHDGILLEVQTSEQIEQAIEIMRGAGADVCHGLEIGVDVDQRLENGARYRDKRKVAQAMWQTMMNALKEIGATDGREAL
ncbi:DNA polymerase [Bradyrhizobium quebecense]|uniref:DNA-directed DNA polymerase family A palm domain-containing protein n=1 Tax=Bradyrhizobium quebecense TaxID=2748629 RepID=A0A973WQC5_9BRAD|nr:DNA polymerase [Bradyrhizobium quebecense]UGA46130.1 DNA polymerase [Bradyrhizobium quebecense]